VTILATIWQDLCFIGAALFFARAAERPWPWQFGLRRVPVWPAVGWAIVAWLGFYAFTAAFVGILGLHPKEDDLPEQLGINNSTIALIVVALLVAVIAPVAEEFFFRGFFFGALRNWKGTWPAALITGSCSAGSTRGPRTPPTSCRWRPSGSRCACCTSRRDRCIRASGCTAPTTPWPSA
jgi:membrane protease YdiL (CAAX protease family)